MLPLLPLLPLLHGGPAVGLKVEACLCAACRQGTPVCGRCCLPWHLWRWSRWVEEGRASGGQEGA